MKRNIFLRRGIFYCLLLLLLLCQACAPMFYAPATPIVPSFRYEKELHAQLAVGSNDATDLDLHASVSYAFDSTWAAGGSFTKMTTQGYGNTGYFGNASMVEFNGGYFKKLKNTRFGFEAFGGLQLGQAQVHHDENYLSYQFIKPYTQGDLNFRTRVIDLLYFVRIGYFSAGNLRLMHLNTDKEMHASFDNFMRSPFMPTVEHGFSFRAGYKGIKLSLNYYFLDNLTLTNRNWAFGTFGASFGLYMDLNWLLGNGLYRESLFRNTTRNKPEKRF